MLTENTSDFINDDFGETVIYQHYNADIKAYDPDAEIEYAIVNDNFPNQEDHPETGTRFAVAEVIVSSDDVTPHHMDRFVFHGYTWDVAPDGWSRSNIFYKAELERSL